MNKSIYLGLVLMLLFGSIQTVTAQNQQSALKGNPVTGVVTDASGSPLPGVTIVVKDNVSAVASTDLDGKYSIVCKPDDVLVFSFIGFAKIEENVGARTLINITMKEEQNVLDEVIIIGYGTTTRRSVVGAVDQIASTTIEDRPVANVTQALQGASPALVIQQTSFGPSASTNINIRGIGTIGDNTPLYVIDGVVADNASFNRLNPNDIDNVSVLKDAGTSAIYGSRAANGVILITTKNGKLNQKAKVKFSLMGGMQVPKLLVSPVEGYQNATLTNVAYVNAGAAPKFTQAQIRDLYENGNGEYWYDTITQNALQQTYNVSVTGGGANSTYMISGGYFKQGSNYVGPEYGSERFNLRANNTIQLKKVKITTQIAYARQNTKSPYSMNLANAIRVPSYYYYRMKDEETGKYLVNDVVGDFNPLGELEAGGFSRNYNNNINLNLGLEYKILNGLKLRGVFGANINANTSYGRQLQVLYYNYRDLNSDPKIGNADRTTSNSTSQNSLLNSQILLEYDRTFAKHHVYALAGVSNESYTGYSHSTRYTMTDPELGIPGDGTLITTSGNSVFPSNTTKRSLNSLFGRAGYDYANKYYLEFTFRYDGSSRFEADSRWGFFPSISGGWRISEENFMGDYKVNMGDLKIRASYGELGNQAVSDYQYLTTWSNTNNAYGFNNVPVAGAGFSLGGDNLTWEVAKTINLGLDATFFKNKLSVTFDWFQKNTDGILVPANAPSLYGATMSNFNAGKMRSQGYEINISYRFNTANANHSLSANLGDAKNTLLDYTNPGISSMEEIWNGRIIGMPWNSYYGYKTDGIFQSYEEIEAWGLNHPNKSYNYQPGDLKYVDVNGDGEVNSDDITYLGNGFPRYTYAFTYNLNWKGFDFGLMLQGVLKRDNFVRGEIIEPFHENYSYVIYKHQLDYWSPTNTDARWPRLAFGGNNNYNYLKGYGSNMQILDAAYLRVKNISMGYTLPEKTTQHIGIEKLRVYVNSQNPITLTKNTFIDPESSPHNSNMSSGANSARNYPRITYWGVGLDITF